MRLFKKVFLLVTSCSLLVTISSCGYTTRSLITDKYKTIYIQQFANKIDITKEQDTAGKYRIYRPMLEVDITQGLINGFLWDGNLKPQREGSADLALKGALVGFRRDPLRYTASDEVEECRLTITVDIELLDNQQNSLLWREARFSGDATYFTTGPAAKSQDAAISEAIKDLVRRVVERTVEEW